MAQTLLALAVQYAGYVSELVLLAYLLRGRLLRQQVSVSLYLTLLLAVDAVGRPFVLYTYGVSSRQYFYFFYVTDVLLALGAFLLVCTFFRRACRDDQNMWRFLRPMLVMTFILVAVISAASLTRNYSALYSAGRTYTSLITEFEQNLYFTCLVLNTLLYILIQQRQIADDELALLVTGLGIQFAGPAASFALMYLTPGQAVGGSLLTYVAPLCFLGMMATWSYALMRAPKSAKVPEHSPVWAGSALPS